MAINDKPLNMIYTIKGKWIGALVFVCVLLWVRHGMSMNNTSNGWNSNAKVDAPDFTSHAVPPFKNDIELSSFTDISNVCYQGKRPGSIEDLQKFVFMLRSNKNIKICLDQYKLFRSLYGIRIKQTTVALSKTFLPKVQNWMNRNNELVEATKRQTLIFVDNKWSLESVVFNPVRAKRPGGQGVGSVAQYVMQLVEKAKQSCDFCAYKEYTATDDFGLMESERSVVISNTFKIEKYHGMVLFKGHDPTKFDQNQFIDAMDLAMAWFKKTNQLVPDHKYRHMYWDILPKASASQVHPHIHLALGDYSYYAKWNILHKAALSFSKSISNWNYWSAVLQVHKALGLSVGFGKASILAYITPQKDLEVVLLSPKPSLDFFRLYFFAVRIFMDELGQFALSSGCVFPKLGADLDTGEELPMICRLLSRGAADLPRSDVSSFDLFGTANVNKDPFNLIKKIESSLAKIKVKYELTVKPKWLS